MNFDINDDKHIIVIDSSDLSCPVTCENYTQQDYPVTLLCGHTLSIKSFNYLKGTQAQFTCPTCRQAIPKDYIPQKTIIWSNIIQQVQDKKGISCYKHKQRRALGICLEEKVFLCLDCLLEDEHPKNKKVSIEKLERYFLQRKDFLKQVCENIQSDKGNKEFGARREKAQELINKLEKLAGSKIVTEKINILDEVETQIKIFEELDKNVKKKTKIKNNFGQKFVNLFKCRQRKQQKTPNPNKEVRYIEIVLISDVDKLAQIQNKKTCTGLQIEFSHSFQNFVALCSNLSKFNFLTSLTLDLEESESINDFFLKKISQCLKTLSFLNILNLNFEECEGIGDKGTIELSSALSGLNSLRNLQLNLRNCHVISPVGINELNMALKSLNSLSKLQLYLSRCKTNEDSFKNLCINIKEMKSLETLELDFARCLVTDDMLKQLSASLGGIISLKTLMLNFSKCKISDNGIKELIIGIKNLQPLVSLHVDFSGCPLVTDHSIKQVSICISELTLLRDLRLEFNYCYSLSDIGIKELSKSLNSLKSIQSLCLSFIGYNSISDGGVEAITQSVKALADLVALQLRFENCCVSSQGMQDLKNVLKKYQVVYTVTNAE